VWVAQKIPDGAVAAHANQARIRTFRRDDPDSCLYADDVVDVAVFYGLYPADADPRDFSFSDVYDPLSFIEARQGEARVWSIFSQVADTTGEFERTYLGYALGEDLSNRMPLYIIPERKLSLFDVMDLMTSHYEGTALDSSTDTGSGLFASPYRPRPLTWSYENATFHNERNVATAKTGWNFVGQVRGWMPSLLAGLVWFACDDSSTSPRVPVYSASTAISSPYSGKGPQDGFVSPLLKLDLTKAFWIQQMVSQLAYARWADVYPLLRQRIDELQVELLRDVVLADENAIEEYATNGAEAAVRYVTQFSVDKGNEVHSRWFDLYGELFVRFRDYYTIVPLQNDPLCGCEAKEPGLSEAVKKRIVDETGDHYKVATTDDNAAPVLSGESYVKQRKFAVEQSDALMPGAEYQ
jgi:dipeptidase